MDKRSKERGRIFIQEKRAVEMNEWSNTLSLSPALSPSLIDERSLSNERAG